MTGNRKAAVKAKTRLILPDARTRRAIARWHTECDQAAGTLFKANLISFRDFERVRKKLATRKQPYEAEAKR